MYVCVCVHVDWVDEIWFFEEGQTHMADILFNVHQNSQIKCFKDNEYDRAIIYVSLGIPDIEIPLPFQEPLKVYLMDFVLYFSIFLSGSATTIEKQTE